MSYERWTGQPYIPTLTPPTWALQIFKETSPLSHTSPHTPHASGGYQGRESIPRIWKEFREHWELHSTKFCPPLDAGTSLPVCQPLQASPLGALGRFGTKCLCPRYYIFKIKKNFWFLPPKIPLFFATLWSSADHLYVQQMAKPHY